MKKIGDSVYSLRMLTVIKAHPIVATDEDGTLYIQWGGRPSPIRLDGETYKGVFDTYYESWDAAHEAASRKCRERIVQAKKTIIANRRAIDVLDRMIVSEKKR